MAVLLALVSSACWGSADFAGGLISRRVKVATVVFLSQATGGAALLALCIVLGEPFPHLFWVAMAAGAIGLCGLLLFYRGLAVGKMSLVAPVAACGAVLPVAFSLVMGQVPRPLTLAGLVSAMAGVVLASLSAGEAPTAGQTQPRAAALMALGAAVCFGLFLLLLGRAARLEPNSSVWLSLCTRLASVPILAAGTAVRGRQGAWRGLNPRLVGAIALVGLGDASANTLFALANTRGALAVVAVLGSLYPLATAGLARFYLGELLSSRQKAGAGLAMLGVVLVTAT